MQDWFYNIKLINIIHHIKEKDKYEALGPILSTAKIKDKRQTRHQ
jgi:hypothetical protein